MIMRRVRPVVEDALARQPAVALLGPRQVGKTTLALEIAASRPAIYLDLESERDRARLADAESFLRANAASLVILDEIHRAPGLFPVLRGLIDDYRRKGLRTGRFLILGSASLDLLKQSGETLAGRVAYVEMTPLDALEVADAQRLWLRGGFPESFLAADDRASAAWREDLIRSYLERDVPMLGPRVPAETLRRLWTMLAHLQGSLLNVSQLAASLGIGNQSVNRYIDLLCDLMLVRRLPPVHANVGKRLVKAPKIYLRDSGILFGLLGIGDGNTLFGHPARGAGWEGFVIENLIGAAGCGVAPGFYRTAAGSKIDLVLERPGRPPTVVEIKATASPKVAKGFHLACADLRPGAKFVVHTGSDRFPLGPDIEAIGLPALMGLLAQER